MVCFPSCFSGSKLLKKIQHPPPPPQNQALNNLATVASELKENVKQDEEVLQKPNHPTFTQPLINIGDKTDNSSRKKVTFDLSANTDAININKQGRKGDETSDSSMDPFVLSISCCPLNNSYRQTYCTDSDEQHQDGAPAFHHSVYDEHGKNFQDNLLEQESSESLFSLSIDSRKQGYASAADNVENEVESPMPFSKNSSVIVSGKETGKATGSTPHVCPVLNPIENISPSLDAGPIFTQISKRKLNGLKQAEEAVGVDTSLSSWLAESETTPKSKGSCSTDSVANSPLMENKSTRNENRPTLRTLKMEELRPFSVCVFPSGSPEEKPIVGTVGSYWSCTGQSQTTDSDFRRIDM